MPHEIAALRMPNPRSVRRTGPVTGSGGHICARSFTLTRGAGTGCYLLLLARWSRSEAGWRTDHRAGSVETAVLGVLAARWLRLDRPTGAGQLGLRALAATKS